MDCPRCHHPQIFDGPDCERCGIVFDRVKPDSISEAPTAAPALAEPPFDATPRSWRAVAARTQDETEGHEEPPASQDPSRSAGPTPLLRPSSRNPLAIGLALAVATQFLPLFQVLIHYMVVLIHELGHAAAGWLFGFPSIPAFDFMYGGGITSHGSRWNLLVGAVFVTLGVLAIGQREIPRQSAAFGAAAVAYASLIATGWDDVVILGMGHGLELIFAALFLYRAATGSGCHVSAERPLYAWLGFHIAIHDLGFAWGLASSNAARAQYGAAKGGGHWMDFSRLADNVFHVPLESVALGFLSLCLLPVPVALIWAHRSLLLEPEAAEDTLSGAEQRMAQFLASNSGSLDPTDTDRR